MMLHGDNDCLSSGSIFSSSHDTKRELRKRTKAINYADFIDDNIDDFYYCERCDQEYDGWCPVHIKRVVEDVHFYSEERVCSPARQSLPSFLSIRKSGICCAGTGVFSEVRLIEGIVFGPYKGLEYPFHDRRVDPSYSWKIIKPGNKHVYVDASDENWSNWLRFINCARNDMELNLQAFQYKGNIYYKTIKTVNVGDELLVFYGRELAQSLGIKDIMPWQCDLCNKAYKNQITWEKHMFQQHAHYITDKIKRPCNKTTSLSMFQCADCLISVRSRLQLVSHLGRVHPQHRAFVPYHCAYCPARFVQKVNKDMHTRVSHRELKPYACKLCDRRFWSQHNCRQHEKPCASDCMVIGETKRSHSSSSSELVVSNNYLW